jgi:hypothetical protein
MRLTAKFSKMPSDCPKVFQKFFFSTWNPDFICMQDGVHMGVKQYSALVNKELVIGNGVASRGVLIALAKSTPKALLGFTEKDVAENKDAMSYRLTEKICNDRVLSRLQEDDDDERGTKTYLKLLQFTIRSYVDPTTGVVERIYKSWYIIFFCRVWKEVLELMKTTTPKEKDRMPLSIERNFISANLHGCFEINGHNMILLHKKCRELKKPEMFLPTKINSQSNENFFRSLRSQGKTNYTVVNFTLLEAIQKSKRIQMLEDLEYSTAEWLKRTNVKQNKFYVPSELLSDEQLNSTILEAYTDVKKEFMKFSKFAMQYSTTH